MQHTTAVQLVQKGIETMGGIWADLGAGSGTFTRALATIIGPKGLIYAIDKTREVLDIGGKRADIEADVGSARVQPIQADFTKRLELANLDGILMANSLHYVSGQEYFLKDLLLRLKPQGKFLLVEYDKTIANPWVPYPLSYKAFQELAPLVGLTEPKMIGRIASHYQTQDIYAAVSTKI